MRQLLLITILAICLISAPFSFAADYVLIIGGELPVKNPFTMHSGVPLPDSTNYSPMNTAIPQHKSPSSSRTWEIRKNPGLSMLNRDTSQS